MASDTFLTDTYLRNFGKELLVSSPYKLLKALAVEYGLDYHPEAREGTRDPEAEARKDPEEEQKELDRLVAHLRTHNIFINALSKNLAADSKTAFARPTLIDHVQEQILEVLPAITAMHAMVKAVKVAADYFDVDDSEEGGLEEILALPSVAPLLHAVATLTPGSNYTGWKGVEKGVVIEPESSTPDPTEPLELALQTAIEESVIYVGVARLARRHLDCLITDNGEDLMLVMKQCGEESKIATQVAWLTQQFKKEVLSHMHPPPGQAERDAMEGDSLAEPDPSIVALFKCTEDRCKVRTFKEAQCVASGAASGAGEALGSGISLGSTPLYAVALVNVVRTQNQALTRALNTLRNQSTASNGQNWSDLHQDLSTQTLDTLVKAMARSYPCVWMADEKRTVELVAEDRIRNLEKRINQRNKPHEMAWDGELGHEMFSIGTMVINFVMTELMEAGARVRCDVDTPPLFVRLREATEEATKVEETAEEATQVAKTAEEVMGTTKDQNRVVKGASESKGSDDPQDQPQDCTVYVWKPKPDRCAVLSYAPSSMLWVHETKHKLKSHCDVAKVVTVFKAKATFDWAVLNYARLHSGNTAEYRELLSRLRTTLTVLSANSLEVLEGSVSLGGEVTVKRVGKYNMLDRQHAARATLKLRAMGQRIVDTIYSRNTVTLMRMLEWCATSALGKLKKVFTLLVSSRAQSARKSGTPDPSSCPGSQTPGPPGGGTDTNNTGHRGSGAPKGGKGGKLGDSGQRSGGRRHCDQVLACTDEAAGGDHNLHQVYFQGEDQTPEEDARIRKACFDMVAMLRKGVKVQIIPGLHGWRYSAVQRRRVTAPACSVFWDDTYTIVYKVVKSTSSEDDMQRRMHEVKGSRVLPVKDVIELSKGRKAIAMPFTHTVNGERPWGISSIAAFIKCGQQLLKALQCLHEAGYYHRDIKPANLANDAMLDVDLVLLDVGLAVHFPTIPKAELLQRTGTEGYMAPELGSQPFSAASEVYSAGITLSKLWASLWDERVDEPEVLADTLDAMTEEDSSKRPSLQQLLASSLFACEEMPATVSPEWLTEQSRDRPGFPKDSLHD